MDLSSQSSSKAYHPGGVLAGVGLGLVLLSCVFLLRQQTVGTMAFVTSEPMAMPAGQERTFQPAVPTVPSRPGQSGETPATAREQLAQPAPVRPPLAMIDQSVRFIVKPIASDNVDTIVANWRRDRDVALAAYSTWSAGDPVFAGMSLEDCSYSGELILSGTVTSPRESLPEAVDELLKTIREHDGVVYADPDFTAFPGQTEN